MKERPIIFSGPMVRAILDGRKTQTRRVLRQQPSGPDLHLCGWDWSEGVCVFATRDGLHRETYCPYGAPRDLLWVREAWGQRREGGTVIGSAPIYRADWVSCPDTPPRWCPSIHMPRWASRLTLLVKSVRVERLQEISEEDAIAEGIGPFANSLTIDCDTESPRSVFGALWDTINGKRAPWARNPWVWVVDFEVKK